jgi:shikimate dehydrogenase
VAAAVPHGGGDPRPAINGQTRLVGVMGWPVAHSRSPVMHNAAFAALGLNWAYVPLAVPPDRVAAAVRGLAALGFAGANVTVPHKAAVLPLMDRLTPVAAAIGSVNTIALQPDGTLLGDSTDGVGLLADLRAHGCEPGGQPVLVIGAGGAARAAVYALAETGATVAIVNRTARHAEELCRLVRQALPGADLSVHRFPADLAALAAGAQLIINTTSLGLHGAGDPLPWDPAVPFRADQTVYDLVYPPGSERGAARLTPVLQMAAAAGAHVINGLGMLVHQGARSFELWTGRPAPVEVMWAAVSEGS